MKRPPINFAKLDSVEDRRWSENKQVVEVEWNHERREAVAIRMAHTHPSPPVALNPLAEALKGVQV